MPKQTQSTLALNRGILSRLGLARIDLNRTAMSAEVMTNWMPRVLGSMMLRVGTEYIGSPKSDLRAKLIDLQFSVDDQAQLELTSGIMRVRIDDELVTRPTVTAAVTNASFTSDVTGWTDNDEAGAASAWLTGGYLALLGTGTNAAIRDQQVTVNQVNTEHALRIVIQRGPVILRVGSTSTGDEYITETTLGTGTHSLAFTPTGDFYIRLMNRRLFTTLVDSVAVESAGAMEVTAPWTDLSLLRTEQSGDVIYVAAWGYQQRKIERRSTRSWSIVLYEPETGPFRNINTGPITIAPSALTGDITLTASKALFRSTHVNALFRVQSAGQTVTATITAENTFTNPIRVAGIEGQRIFGISITGTFVATLTLQYSISEPGNWVDVTTYTTPQSISHDDGLDNQIIYYRIGVKTGAFTSGSAVAALSYTSGSITGVARITAYTSSTVVSAIVLADFGSTTASSDWWEGIWSDRRGWPSAVTLYEGRAWFAGNDDIIGSITDQFEDFDDEFEGDAGPISRSIGSGPIQRISWLLPLSRLMVGTLLNSANIPAIKLEGNHVLSGRSSSFDEPLTPTNFNLKSAAASGIFVQRSRRRVMSLNFDLNESDYKPEDLTTAVPDLNDAGITHIAIQYQPDIRLHCLREDGTVAVMVMDKAENVICWIEIEIDGTVEDISIRSGAVEDLVYYTVLRGSTRLIGKFALESECRGGTANKQADFFVHYSGAATTTITGLDHLEGEEVIAWGDGVDLSPGVDEDQTTYTVTGGQITLAEAVSVCTVGLPYSAPYKSGKQAFAAAMGTPLNRRKKIDHVGLILADTHAKGLQYGPDFDSLDDLPEVEDHEEVDADYVWESYDKDMLEFDGDWDTDSRFCLKAHAPRPCTVLAVSVSMTTSG